MLIVQDFTAQTTLLVGIVRRYNSRTLKWLRKLAKEKTTNELVFRHPETQRFVKTRFAISHVALRENERPMEDKGVKYFPTEVTLDFLPSENLDVLHGMLETHTIQVMDKYFTVGFEVNHRLDLEPSLGEVYAKPPKLDPFSQSPQWDHQEPLAELATKHPIVFLARGQKRTDGVINTSVMLQRADEPHLFTELVYAEDGWRYESDTSNRDWQKDYERCNLDSAMTLVYVESISRIYNP